jgi:site-specific recombinase XerD
MGSEMCPPSSPHSSRFDPLLYGRGWGPFTESPRDWRTLRGSANGCTSVKVTVPKGGRERYLPLTVRLASALRTARHLRGDRVLCDEHGAPLTQKEVQGIMRRVARRAGVRPGVHILRHTFCSHLAMRGATAKAIQELAGHEDLKTTQRYMHISPVAIEDAIRLLDSPRIACWAGQ